MLHSSGCPLFARRPVALACSIQLLLSLVAQPPNVAGHATATVSRAALLICWQQHLHAHAWAAGTLKLASLVQYVPLPVVGGYLGYVGYFCFASGASVATGESSTSSHEFLCLFVWLLLHAFCR